MRNSEHLININHLKKTLFCLLLFIPILVSAQSDPIACSCVLGANLYVPGVPLVNAEYFRFWGGGHGPHIGSVMVQWYNDKKTKEIVYHLSVIAGYALDGFIVKETNFNDCKYGTRIVPYNSPHIISFLDFGEYFP